MFVCEKHQISYSMFGQYSMASIYSKDFDPSHRIDSQYIVDILPKVWSHAPYDRRRSGAVMALQVCEQTFAATHHSAIAAIFHLWLLFESIPAHSSHFWRKLAAFIHVDVSCPIIDFFRR